MPDASTPAAAQNHLYLVDGSSYIFRAYHRLPPLTNRHGQPAGAVYGYTTMLWKLADGLSKADGPTHMAVILDASEHTHRNEMYDQYKAHRPPPPEDLVPQFPLIRVATRAFSIPCIEEEGLEADDIIACYVTAAKAAGWKVTIVSSDKDLMQLIDEDAGIDMLDTMNDRRIGREQVLEKFGVPHEIRIMSSSRNPDLVDEYARTASERGLNVVICSTGMSGHLAAAVAARTILPVIGVPIASSPQMVGNEALAITAQMPMGVPVATVGVESAVNAAVLAAQIIAITDKDVQAALWRFKDDLAEGLKL